MKYVYLSLLLSFLPVGFSSADSFTRIPSGSGEYTQVVYTVQVDNIESICLSPYPDATYWSLESPQGIVAPEQYPLTQDTGTFTLPIGGNGAPFEISQVVTNCDNYQGSLSSVEYDGGNVLFTLIPEPYVPPAAGFINADSAKTLINDSVVVYGFAILGILASIIVLMVALLVFKFGWQKLTTDQSLTIGGYYLRKLPYQGYNRWRSRKWNSENTF